jgi:hypothetical protein
MVDHEPSVKDMAALWKLCAKFVEDNNITCAETVYQSDRVIHNAYMFMHEVCKNVGFVDYEDEDEDDL